MACGANANPSNNQFNVTKVYHNLEIISSTKNTITWQQFCMLRDSGADVLVLLDALNTLDTQGQAVASALLDAYLILNPNTTYDALAIITALAALLEGAAND